MFCSKCGKELTGEVAFCSVCGTAVSPTRMKERKLRLSANDKKILGVCGGLAEYLEVDSTLVRLIWVLLALAGMGLVAYPLAWLIMPRAMPANTMIKVVEPAPAVAAPLR